MVSPFEASRSGLSICQAESRFNEQRKIINNQETARNHLKGNMRLIRAHDGVAFDFNRQHLATTQE
jgi:hypothetical protein